MGTKKVLTMVSIVQTILKKGLETDSCVLPSGSMPTDYELYYGFTRFAIELNELCPEMQDLLPPTDARFRPDQR